MEATKEQVIRLFLTFLSRYVPIGQAQMATLGGRGLEAKIWSELGVPTEHGWLIERSRERAENLIINHRYGTHNQLGTFDRILAGYGEDRAFIDAFHLDLCGTFCNTAINNFSPILPLVLKSKGRCLAITVADQRRNLVLEQWPSFRARARKLFGDYATKIYENILSQQRCVPVKQDSPAFIKPFDSEKAAKREFGLLVEMAELLNSQSLPWIPVAVERYIYVSRFQRRPFRMRTYLFRFGQQTQSLSEPTLAHAWVGSKLFFANGNEFTEVKTLPLVIEVKPSTKGSIMETTKIIDLSGYVAIPRSEYDLLLADSQQLHAIRQALEGVASTGARTVPPSGEQLGGEPHAKRTRRPRKNWEDLTDREQIEWQLKALELKAQNGGHFPNGTWQKLLKEDFGHYNEDLGRSLRSALARTSGGFRQMFEKRIQTIFGDDAKTLIDRLAKV